MTPQNPDETQDDEERSGARTKRRRAAILILVALILGYPAYKEDVFATVGVDVKQVARTAQWSAFKRGRYSDRGRRLIQHISALQVWDSSHSKAWQAGPIAESGCSQLVFEASGAHLS